MADSKRGEEFEDELDDRADLAADEDDLTADEDDLAADGDGKGAKAVATASKSAKRTAKPRKRDDADLTIFGRLVRFVREVVAEMQKVIYPTRKELLTYTAVVLVFVSTVTALVALADVGFAKLMLLVFGDQTST